MSTKELSKSIKQLQSLNALYKNDEYMCEKLHLYVQNNLPNIMKNIKIGLMKYNHYIMVKAMLVY